MMTEMIDFATSEIKDFKVKMLKYYVDDGDIISSVFPAGAKLCKDGKVRVIQEKIQEDAAIPPDKRTAELFGVIGNMISLFIIMFTNIVISSNFT